MTNANDPINAFEFSDKWGGNVFEGLTKREYFAGLIMAAYYSDNMYSGSHEKFAKGSVAAADALINALNKAQNDESSVATQSGLQAGLHISQFPNNNKI